MLGTITAKQSRWGDSSRRWMVTDYALAIENVVYSPEKEKPLGTTVMLTYWGGTIGSETQAIADVRLPVVGERLLLFLRPNWDREVSFTPVVGFNEGLFTVTPDVAGGEALVRDAFGEPVGLAASGDVVRRVDGPADAPAVSIETFINWLRVNINSIKASPSERSLAFDQNDPRVMRPFAKAPSLLTKSPDDRSTVAARAPLESPDAEFSAGVPSPSGEVLSGPDRTAPYGNAIVPNYVTSGKTANLPIVVNNFPASFTPWSPEDQYQMSKWNYYASDVFHVYTSPTGTYSWTDGVFDLAGFPSSADLQSVYGSTWDSNTIAVTFLRYNLFNLGSTIVEADIAINPAFGFTLDDEWVFNGSGNVQSFRLTLLHELGHMHGLNHQFNYLAVMNYFPAFYRFFGLPYMDDAQGIRAEYPSNAVNRTDLGVYLYYETGFQSVSDATYPSSVVAGGSLTATNYHVENVGTNTISTPTIEWYLTAARNFNSSYYYLGQATYSSLAPFTSFTPSTVPVTFTVPSTVPSGSYYLSAFIRNDSGASQSSFPFSNNYAFSRTRIQVSAPSLLNPPTLVSPGTTTAPGSSIATLTPTFNWQQVTGADGYGLYVSRFNGSTYDLIFNSETDVGHPLTGTSYVLPAGRLQDGNQYRWNMSSHNSAGYGTPNVSRNYFYVSLPAQNYTITVSASPSVGGTVSGNGTFAAGSSRTVTATANSGYTFVNWTENGGVVSTSASYTFTLNSNRTLVANFSQNQTNYTISLSVSPSGAGTVSGSGTFSAGTSRTVTASANSGYTFANWKEGGTVVSASSSYTFTLNSNRTLVANFTAIGCTYSLSAANLTLGPDPGTASIFINAPSGCSWSAVSDATSWLTTSSSGSGNGRIDYNFTKNNSTSTRIGHITAGGQVHTVTQLGLGGAGSVQFSSATYSINENGSSITITVTRTGGTESGSVQYATSDGTATVGSDYTGTSGTLIFGTNEMSKTFSVPIIDDSAVEGNETITLSLRNQSGSFTIGSPSTATLTILDNDSQIDQFQWSYLDGRFDKLAVGKNSDGRLEVFVRGTDGALWHRAQTSPGSVTWGSWSSLGGWFDRLAVARNADGRLQVFVRGADGALDTITQSAANSSSWSNWSWLGGWIDNLSAEINTDGRLEVFVSGSDNSLWHRAQASAGSASWAGWSPLGGWIDRLAVARNADGRLDVYVRGSNGGLWHRAQATAGSASWGSWSSLGGWFDRLAVGRNQDGRLEVFVRGADGALDYRTQTVVNADTWGAWSWLGGWIDNLAISNSSDGRLQVFVSGSDGALYCRSQFNPNSDVWNDWLWLSGWIDQLAAGSSATGYSEVFARGSNQGLWHRVIAETPIRP
ncbi:MAG TPA: Calx-beta domain-containing protein [Pyrinomonadaceae bacterium]|nr:Calx-beta domain-containing protein [Pyrinomonadaceae bacterium]